VLNQTEQPKPAPVDMITMVDKHRNEVVIPVAMENMVAIFKAMGYREVKLNPEPDHAADAEV